MPTAPSSTDPIAPTSPPLPNVRKTLALLRARWDRHGPASPLCLAEELEPGGMTIADFCVRFLLAQRTRRNVVREE